LAKKDVVVIIELETSFLLVASPLIEAKVNRKRGKNIGVVVEGKCQFTCMSRELLTDTHCMPFTHTHTHTHTHSQKHT